MYYGTKVHLVHVLFSPPHFLLQKLLKDLFWGMDFQGSGNSKFLAAWTK